MNRLVLKKNIKKTLFYIFLTLFTMIWLMPFLFIIFTAFKSNTDFYSGSYFSFPKKLEWQNFIDAWKIGKMSLYFTNSLVIVLIRVPLGILIASLAAFSLTKMNFKYSNAFFVVILIGMMLPIQVALVPLTIQFSKLSMLDNPSGLITAYLGFGIPFGIFLLRGYFRTLPQELDDSAKIDGCSDFARYWKIVLPLSKPVIGTLIILDFLDTWNEFLLALLFIKSERFRTLPLGLSNFKDRFGAKYWSLMAAVLICIIPIMIIYMMFQRYFISGITAGAVKG